MNSLIVICFGLAVVCTGCDVEKQAATTEQRSYEVASLTANEQVGILYEHAFECDSLLNLSDFIDALYLNEGLVERFRFLDQIYESQRNRDPKELESEKKLTGFVCYSKHHRVEVLVYRENNDWVSQVKLVDNRTSRMVVNMIANTNITSHEDLILFLESKFYYGLIRQRSEE